MHRLLDLAGMTVGGWLGWFAGAWAGLFAGIVTSAIGSGLGLYLVRRFKQHYLE